MAVYGKTWWGKRWLEAFRGAGPAGYWARGQNYAATGRVHDIAIVGSRVRALVRGSANASYEVDCSLVPLTREQQAWTTRFLANALALTSQLFNRNFPPSLEVQLLKEGISLFPKNWQDIDATCSCPHNLSPCKHIAALVYVMASQLDKNPLLLFALRGVSLETEPGARPTSALLGTMEVALTPATDFVLAPMTDITFSKIPMLFHRIQNLLGDETVFYGKNFRPLLEAAYKVWMARNARTQGRLTPLSEEGFFKKWGAVERFQTLSLDMTHRCKLQAVWGGQKKLLEGASLGAELVLLLQDMPLTLLQRLGPEAQFLHLLLQFGNILLSKAALIPQILQDRQGVAMIRWIPALFDLEVRRIFQQLVAACPPGLVVHHKHPLRPEEQVKFALSWILLGAMQGTQGAFLKNPREDICQLFFYGVAFKFNDFTNKEIPPSIALWLSRLYLWEKDHKIYIQVEEKAPHFAMTFWVELKEGGPRLALSDLLHKKTGTQEVGILSDIGLLMDYIPHLVNALESGGPLVFDLESFSPLFLNIFPILESMGIRILLPASLKDLLVPRLQLALQSDKRLAPGLCNLETLLSFDWKMALGHRQVGLTEFQALMAKSHGLVRVGGGYVLLEEGLLNQIERLPRGLSQMDLLQAVISKEYDGADVSLDAALQKMVVGFSTQGVTPIPKGLKGTLRPYQARGFSWMMQNIQAGFGSILADDMGLGKTIQVLAVIMCLKELGELAQQKVLVIAPTGLLSNWQKEIERFAPGLTVHLYHGPQRRLEEADIILTSYGLARMDLALLAEQSWCLMVLDEAQNIKNPTTAQTKAIKNIPARHRIALSGTPVENRMEEYWSIFDFTNKNYLGTAKGFKTRFALPIEQEHDKDCLERFIKITRPFMLRRLKSDKSIIQDLPDKLEADRYCALSPEQTVLYQKVVEETMEKIQASEGIARKGLVLQLITALKQICNHPHQFTKRKGAKVSSSGKMQMLEEILREIQETGEKVLIFTQYREMGEILSQVLEERLGCKVPFLHGGLSRASRDRLVTSFQEEPNPKILIVSLKAGGTGLNLTAANHVIHYDLWWNPAVETQATDRAYRIGSKKQVMVYRFLCVGTFEERINDMIQRKKHLAEMTVSSGENWITEMSNAELQSLVSIRQGVVNA